ncbi:MAG: glutathione S-transferase family protein [Burkholderiales bacterium]
MEPILHHYDISPYSEKVRLIFGLKQMSWRSVIQPMVLPKPHLIPLSGGYRRIPVLQIGADIFCDTNLIAATLERLQPEPTIFPGGRRAETEIWCTWAERVLMWPTARYVTFVNDDRLGAAFHADRAAMRGHPPPNAAEMAAAIPHHREQCRIMLTWLDELLADHRPFLLGKQPGLADFAVYQRIWWLHAFEGRATDVLDGLASLCAWTARVKAIGHGMRIELEAAKALDVARVSAPDAALHPTGLPLPPAAGAIITIGTEGHAPDATIGTVVRATAEAIALTRDDDRLGRLMVHFPRLGYHWQLSGEPGR